MDRGVGSPLVIQPHAFSAASVHGQTLAGQTVAQIVAGAAIVEHHKPFLHVWIGDREIPRQWWPHLRPKAGVVVYLKVVAHGGGGGGGGKNPLQTVLSLAVIAASFYFAGPLGTSLLGTETAAIAVGSSTLGTLVGGAVISLAGNLLIGALIPPPQPPKAAEYSVGAAVAPTYQITGTSNKMNPYGPIPRVLGKRRVFPVMAARPYTESAGNEQYVRLLLLVGYGPLQISELKIGETPIAAFAGVDYEITEGGPSGWGGNADITLYTQTVTETVLNVTLTSAGGWQTRNTAAATREISVDVTFPRGLFVVAGDGSRSGTTVETLVQYRKSGDVTWLDAPWENDTDTGFTVDGKITTTAADSSAVRMSGRWLVADAAVYEVRLQRSTADAGASTFDTTVWTALRSVVYTPPVVQDNVCLIAMRIKASEQLNGIPDTINCVAESYLPVWDGADWTFEISRNPAWAYTDLLRRRGGETLIADSRIDLATMMDWADECDATAPNAAEPYWQYDAVIEGGAVFDALKQVAAHGRASYAIKDGQYSVVRDVEQTVPVQHITPRNSWGYSGSKAFIDLPHALKVQFINADLGYQQDEVIVYDDGYNADGTYGNLEATRFETISLLGCLSATQAWREGRYYLAVGRLRPEEHKVSMDIENLRCTLGDLVYLQQDAISVGLASGRIKAVTESGGDITDVQLDGPVDLLAGVEYGLVVRKADGTSVSCAITPVGSDTATDALNLITPLAVAEAPEVDDLAMFGLLGSETAPMIVKRIEGGPDLSAVLTMADAQPGVWTADTGTIPAFDSNITVQAPIPARAPATPGFDLRSDESAAQRLADGTVQERIGVLIYPPSYTDVEVYDFEVQYRRSDGVAWISAARADARSREVFLFPVVRGQDYDVRVRALSIYGVAGEWATETDYTVIGNIAPPSDITGFSASAQGARVALTWDEIPDLDRDVYEIRIGASFAAGALVFLGKAHSAFDTMRAPGSYTYWAMAYDTTGNPSNAAVSAAFTVATTGAPTVTASLAGADAVLSWTVPSSTFPIDRYEIRIGSSWASAVPLASAYSTSFKTPVNWVGSQTFLVAAIDGAGNVGTAGSVAVTVTAPGAPVVTASIEGPSYKLKWTAPSSSITISEFEVRHGASYAAGTFIARLKGTEISRLVDWSGNRTFWVAGYDANGNEGTSASASVNLTAPSAPSLSTQVIDNNVLLFWSEATGTLPIATYEIRKGATYAGSTLIGNKSGLFTNLFETQAGTYTYWVTAIDTAGNYGTPASVAATMSQPPDYVLQADYFSDFSGTLDHALANADGSLILPVVTTETYTQHFTNNSWATPQAQITAGYPVYIEPSASSGYYEETIDYGSTLAASKVTLTPTYQVLDGSPVVTTDISVSADGSSWTDYTDVSEVFAGAFRYIKIRFNVASSGGDDLVQLTALNTRLDVKLKNDGGMVECDSADTGGTDVTFSVEFIDVTSITVTPEGTTAVIATYDFVDDPYPVSMKVLLFNPTTGARVSGTASWSVKGY